MISAVVLAAGQSKRMGQNKMLLPWGVSTVIDYIISTLLDAGVEDIHIVVGGLRKHLSKALRNYQLKIIYNKDYRNGEMLTSIKLGIQSLPDETEAALIVLGDQPQIDASIVQAILKRYSSSMSQLIVPSYKMKRGHPLLIARPLWNSLLKTTSPMTLRDFLELNNKLIDYLVVDNQSVVQDMDTPDDYFRYKP
jgi:molybdenum cofactor cytidylyltransferase